MRSRGRRLGLVGCGAIGTLLAVALKRKASPFTVSALYDHHPESSRRLKKRLGTGPLLCNNLPTLIRNCDLVLEAASQEAAPQVARAALSQGRPVLLMSTGGFFLERKALLDLARKKGVKIYLPSGALCGLDGVRAARVLGPIQEATILSTKPPRGLLGAPGLTPSQERKLRSAKAPTLLYRGEVKGALRRFPANVNVAATFALATGSPGKVRVAVLADPKAKYNQHRIFVRGPFGELESLTRNRPSSMNPKTSALAVQSALALLERLGSPLEVGN